MKLNYDKKVFLFFSIFSLGLVILGVLTYINAREKIKQSKWVAHTYEVLFKTNQLISLAQDNETGSRGYIITGDPSFLEPYLASEQVIFNRLNELQQLTRDNPTQQVRIDSLQQLLEKRMEFSEQTIQARDSSGYEAAALLVTRKTGKYYMDEIRRVIHNFQNAEYDLLEKRNSANAYYEKAFLLSFYSLLLTGFIFLVVSLVFIRSNHKYRKKLERRIKNINKDLAKKVEEKSREVIEKEQRYHFVLENMREGAMILGHDWKYHYANKSVLKWGKLPIFTALGETVGKKDIGSENGETFEALEFCMRERVSQIKEVELAYPDGSKGFYKLSLQPIPEGLFILSMDITERKKREIDRERYIKELQEVLFKISHELRQPVTQILGLTNLFDYQVSLDELQQIAAYMKQSALMLDDHTRELTNFVSVITTNSENES